MAIIVTHYKGYTQVFNTSQANYNILNQSLDKFAGTWKWTNGIDTLELILKKQNILLPFPENSRADTIIGYRMYKRGDTIIEFSKQFENSMYTDKKHTILGAIVWVQIV